MDRLMQKRRPAMKRLTRLLTAESGLAQPMQPAKSPGAEIATVNFRRKS
jgi:hypothetical protein